MRNLTDDENNDLQETGFSCIFSMYFLSNSDQIRYLKSIGNIIRLYIFDINKIFPETVQKTLTMLNGLVKQNLISQRNLNQSNDVNIFFTDIDGEQDVYEEKQSDDKE